MNFVELGAQLGLEEEEYMELIGIFIESVSDALAVIREGLAAADAEQVMRSAHTIKGAAGNLRLMAMYETAGSIEQSAIEQHLAGLPQVVAVLESQFEAVRAAART